MCYWWIILFGVILLLLVELLWYYMKAFRFYYLLICKTNPKTISMLESLKNWYSIFCFLFDISAELVFWSVGQLLQKTDSYIPFEFTHSVYSMSLI